MSDIEKLREIIINKIQISKNTERLAGSSEISKIYQSTLKSVLVDIDNIIK